MCVLALILDPGGAVPLTAGANRDEFLARPSLPPHEIEPGIVAGKDRQAGGTWLGVNRDGLFVAVTNRHEPERAPGGFSRGLLVLESLRCASPADVEDLVRRRLTEQRIAGFNLVAVRRGAGVCLHYDGELRPVPLAPGDHVVSTGRDLDDPDMPEKTAFDAWRAGAPGTPSREQLAAFLATHDGERPPCKHGDRFGTVSSTIYVERKPTPLMLHAGGKPCEAGFEEVDLGF